MTAAPEDFVVPPNEGVPQAALVTQGLRKNLQHIEAVAAADYASWRPLALISPPEELPVLRKGYNGDIAESPANVRMLSLLCQLASDVVGEVAETVYEDGKGAVHTSRTTVLLRPEAADIYLRQVVSVTESGKKSRVTARNYKPEEPETLLRH